MMEVHPADEVTPSYRERSVSELASMFDSKFREKVQASPYLRHYGKFGKTKLYWKGLSSNLENGENNNSFNEPLPPAKIKSMTVPHRIKTLTVKPYILPEAGEGYVFADPNRTPLSDTIDDIEAGNSKRGRSMVQRSVSDVGKGDEVGARAGAAKVHYRCVEDVQNSPIASTSAVSSGSQSGKGHKVKDRKASAGLDSSESPSKHRRFGIQRLLRKDKRKSSSAVDSKEVEKMQGLEAKDGIDGAEINSCIERENETPKLSAVRRRRSDGEASGEHEEATKKVARRRNSKLKGFFRAISMSNVSEAKRASAFEEENLCPGCQEKRAVPRKAPSLESFNSLKDERDLLRGERDRAVEEWSEAASRWEHMLDDMDALMAELIQVRSERDDKTQEISDLINEYEDELRIRETDYDKLQADCVEIEDQLTVAKKERLDALTEYDELLKRNYDLSKELEESDQDNMDLQSIVKENEQNITSLKQQLENLQQERDQALELWNTSVEERKKLHQEMASLIQSRDASLRKTFQQAEELNKMKEDRDALQRAFTCKRGTGLLESQIGVRIGKTEQNLSEDDSGFSAGQGEGSLDISNTRTFPAAVNYDPAPDPDYVEFAVSLERLDSKFGIRLETAVDEPNIMIVHVGAHAASKSNIRKYDRLISVNGVSVIRSDKKTVEKLIRDGPGRLTMVLRRENASKDYGSIRNVDIIVPKSCNHRSSKGEIGLKCKMQVTSIDDSSTITGIDSIDAGDIITKINTQDISKVFEAVLRKMAKKSNGKISLRLQKRGNTTHSQNKQSKSIQPPSPCNSQACRSLSNISQSSNQSISSFTSEQTIGTDDNESLFGGSLTPSIILCPCNENREKDDDIASLPERLRLFSNPWSETGSIPEGPEDGESSDGQLLDEDPMSNGQIIGNGHPRLGKRHSDIRSLRSLKNVSSGRPNKPLRRVRSDAFDRRSPQKEDSPKQRPQPPRTLLLDVKEKDSTQRKRNSWLIPSPTHTPTETRKKASSDSVSMFATLPRKKKTVNDADCNKRTTHRVLRLEKSESQPLGFDVCGGNKVGIFVKDIKDASMAALGGMKVGDRILYINSFDLHCATLDFATRIILRSERLTHFRIEVKFEEKFKDMMKEMPRDSLYVRTVRPSENSKDGYLKFSVGEILHVTNTLANYSKTYRNISWQWYAEKMSRNAAGEQGFVPRLESFIEHEESDTSSPQVNVETDPDKTPTNVKRKRRKSAADVKKWLLKKPSINRKKKDKEAKESSVESVDRSPFYEIVWDN